MYLAFAFAFALHAVGGFFFDLFLFLFLFTALLYGLRFYVRSKGRKEGIRRSFFFLLFPCSFSWFNYSSHLQFVFSPFLELNRPNYILTLAARARTIETGSRVMHCGPRCDRARERTNHSLPGGEWGGEGRSWGRVTDVSDLGQRLALGSDLSFSFSLSVSLCASLCEEEEEEIVEQRVGTADKRRRERIGQSLPVRMYVEQSKE